MADSVALNRDSDARALATRARKSGFWGGIIASVVASLTVGAVSALFPSLWNYILTPSVPSGAIMAFDRPDAKDDDPCPWGWYLADRLQGRFIVGAVPKDATLGNRKEGGHDSIVLTADQLPPHEHSFYYLVDNNSLRPNGTQSTVAGISLEARPNYTKLTLERGGQGKKVETLPPYRALFYCAKR